MLGRGHPRLLSTLGALLVVAAASLLFLSLRAFHPQGDVPRVSQVSVAPPALSPAPLVPDMLEWTGMGEPPSISVLLWDYSTWASLDMPDRVPTPNYVGHEVIKAKCPVPCHLYHDRCLPLASLSLRSAHRCVSALSIGRTLQRRTACYSSQ